MADSREPPFEGGAQPVKQEPSQVPPSRTSPRALVMGLVIVLILAAGLVFIFSH